jgi:sec-independent protein translocase protein TatA
MVDNFAFLNIGTPELLLLLLIVLLLFGSRKLPELARSLGSSMKEVRKGFAEGDDDKTKKQTDKPKP